MNAFEQCPVKKFVRESVASLLVSHIVTREAQVSDYVFLPGVNGYTEKIISNKLPRCPKKKPVTFHFFERNSSIRRSWSTTKRFVWMEDKLQYKNYRVTHNRLVDDSRSYNGGWIDLCAPRTHKVADLVYSTMTELQDNGLMFFTWGDTFAHIPKSERSEASPEIIVQNLNAFQPNFKYTLVWDHSYTNEFSYGKAMSTFGISKKRVDNVEIPDIIANDMKNTTKTKTKRTVEDYIRLASRGFTNKQIAVYWKTSLRSIAAYQANVNR